MSSRSSYIPNFEARSVVLMTTLVLGVALAHARETLGPEVAAPLSISTSSVPAPTTPAAPVAKRAYSSLEIAAAFKLGDRNGDGRIDREEIAAYPRLLERFDQVDTNQDGWVTMEEWSQAVKG